MSRKKEKTIRIVISKEELRPKERAPILPSKIHKDKRKSEKHKKKITSVEEEEES